MVISFSFYRATPRFYSACLAASVLSAAVASVISSILRLHPTSLTLFSYFGFYFFYICKTFCAPLDVMSENDCSTSCMPVVPSVSVCFQSACSFPGNWKGPSWAVISVFLSPSQPKVPLWGTKCCRAALSTHRVRERHTHSRANKHTCSFTENVPSLEKHTSHIGERAAAGFFKTRR